MASRTRDPLAPSPEHTNTPLSGNVTEAGTWGLPSDEGRIGQQGDAALVPPSPYPNDYAGGMFVGQGMDANAQARPLVGEHLIRARVDTPTFQLPHEATHRRYDAPLTIPINQSAAGYTLIAAARPGLHYVKVLAAMITLDAAGTIKLVQGNEGGLGVTSAAGPGDMTGSMSIGAATGFVLPPAKVETPWMFTAPNQALGLFTVTGKAAGFVMVCYSPYDA